MNELKVGERVTISYVCLQSGSIKKLIEKKIKDILGD